jgi:hypothetical protein
MSPRALFTALALTSTLAPSSRASADPELDYAPIEGAEQPSAAKTSPHTVRTSGSRIEIDFDPKLSSEIGAECTEIGHLQFIQMWAVYTDRWRLVKPGEVRAKDAWLDATLSDAGHAVDTCRGADPVYQDPENRGSSAGTHATMSDLPNLQHSDLAPYHPETNKEGWAQMVWRFQTYAYCVSGAAKGTWYEGIAWTWEVYANQVRPGDGVGTSAFVTDMAVPVADASVRQALERYRAAPRHYMCRA